jgi:hypothetical protein
MSAFSMLRARRNVRLSPNCNIDGRRSGRDFSALALQLRDGDSGVLTWIKFKIAAPKLSSLNYFS